MDQKTKKLMTMSEILHSKNDIDKLYVSRREGESQLARIDDSKYATIKGLEEHTKKTNGDL